tara:strand:+ start:110 stop:580 length:471 start_codon:yes stop_codon:yes gene_type:complete
MYLELLALLGLFIGWFIASKTKEELKPGKKYFNLICHISLSILIIGALYVLQSNITIINILALIVGGIISLLIIKKTYLGIGSLLPVYSTLNLFTPLAFLFSLAFAALQPFSYKKGILNTILFTLPLAVYLVLPHLTLLFFYTGLSLGSIKKWYTQ